MDNSGRLRRHRQVVECSHTWLNRFRRLGVRYERRTGIFPTFKILNCAPVFLNQIRQFCQTL